MTSRQLFPPNPSVKPSVIFFGPHHDGVADVLADDVAAVTSTHAAQERKREQRSTSSSVHHACSPFLFMVVRIVFSDWRRRVSDASSVKRLLR